MTQRILVRTGLGNLLAPGIEVLALGWCGRALGAWAVRPAPATRREALTTAITLKAAIYLRLRTSGDERGQPVDAAIVGHCRLWLRLLLGLIGLLLLLAMFAVMIVLA